MQVRPLKTDMLGCVTLHKVFDLYLSFPISKIIYLSVYLSSEAVVGLMSRHRPRS